MWVWPRINIKGNFTFYDSLGLDNADANADAKADNNNNINIKYLNIGLLTGIVLILGVPTLIQKMTGVSIYDQSLITESIYSESLIKIRKTCATVFVSLLSFLLFLNIDRLKRTILKKPIMWAPIFVKGGFEGLGDPELDTQHVSPNTMRTFNSSKLKENEEDLLSLALYNAQNESLSTNSSTTPPRLNLMSTVCPIPYPPGCKTAGPSTGSPYFGSFNWYSPSSSPLTPPGTPLSHRLRLRLQKK